MSLSFWSASTHGPLSCPQTFLSPYCISALVRGGSQTLAVSPVEQRDVPEVCGGEILGDLAAGA